MHMACQMLSASSPAGIHTFTSMETVIQLSVVSTGLFILCLLWVHSLPLWIFLMSIFPDICTQSLKAVFILLFLLYLHIYFLGVIISIFKIGPKSNYFPTLPFFFLSIKSLFAFSWIVATSSNLTLSSPWACPPLSFSVSRSRRDFKGAGER